MEVKSREVEDDCKEIWSDLFSGGGLFAQGMPYLQLITFFYVFAAIQSSAIFSLRGVGKVCEVLVVGVVTALGEIALSVSLVPVLGPAGATYSRVTVMTLGCASPFISCANMSRGLTTASWPGPSSRRGSPRWPSMSLR